MRNPLISRDFALLAIGHFVSAIGDRIHYVALSWWIIEKTGSPAAMAAISMSTLVPAILLGPFLGVYADRLDRRKVVICMDYARGAVIGALAGLALSGRLELWHLYVGTVLVSAASSLFEPAAVALVPRLVPEDRLRQSQAVQQGMSSLVGVFGPALGGVLIGLVGIPIVFAMNAISFALSALSEMFISYTHSRTEQARDPFSGVREGFRFIMAQRTLPWMMGMFAVANFAYVPLGSILLPFIIKEILGLTARQLGLVFASMSAGGVLGSILAGAAQKTELNHKPIITFAIINGCFFMSWIFLPTLWWLYTVTFMAGVCAPLIQVNVNMIFFKLVPDHMRGKVFAFRGTFALLVTPLSLAFYGTIAEVWRAGVPYLVFLTGFLVASSGFGMRFVPGFRDL